MRVLRIAALALVATTAVSVVAAGRAAAQETPSDSLLDCRPLLRPSQAVSGPQISPGRIRRIVYTRRWVNKVEDRYESTLWIMRADGSHNRMLTKGSDPQWSPDGTRIAYLADGDPKGAQIYMRWTEGEQGPTQLTHLTESPSDIKWSPDGKSVGFTSFVPKPVVWAIDMPKAPDSAHWTKAPRIVESLHYKEDRRGFQDPGFRHLFVVSVDGGPARQLTSGDWNVGARFDGLASGPVTWDWTPDGKTIIVEGLDDPEGDYRFRDANLYAVDVASGSTHALTTEHGYWRSPAVSPDGHHIAYIGFPATDQTYRTSNMYVMDIDGSHAHALTESFDRDAVELHWAHDGTGVYFVAEDHGSNNIHFVPAAGGPVRSVTTGPEVVSLGSISSAGIAAITRATAQRPPEVARLDLRAKIAMARCSTAGHVTEAGLLADLLAGTLEEDQLHVERRRTHPGLGRQAAGLRRVEEVPAHHGDPRRTARGQQQSSRSSSCIRTSRANQLRRLLVRRPRVQHWPRHTVRRGHQQGLSERGLRRPHGRREHTRSSDAAHIDSKRMFVGGGGGGVFELIILADHSLRGSCRTLPGHRLDQQRR